MATTITRQGVFTPSVVDLTASEYLEESSPFSNAYGKGSDNEGNYAEWGLVTGAQAYTRVYYTFDLSSIPSDAIITNVTCAARCSNTNASIAQGGNTLIALGTIVNGNEWTNKVSSDNAAFGTTAVVVTVNSTDFTREELDNFRLKIQAVRGFLNTSTSYHTKFYGATLTIDYTVNVYEIISSTPDPDAGSITSSTEVEAGGSKTFTFTPKLGYRIKRVIVNGIDLGPMSSYTFTNVNEDSTIEVEFEAIPNESIVIAGIDVNKLYAIGLFEGETNMSLYIDGLHIVDVYEDLSEGESMCLDENGILHIYEFIEEV